MTSPFIEGSKHPELTKAVEDHFGMSNNNKPRNGALPAPAHTLGTFTGKNDQGGVNYTLQADAGHFVRDVKSL